MNDMGRMANSRLGVLACLLLAACAAPPPKQADNYDESPPDTSSASVSRSPSSSGPADESSGAGAPASASAASSASESAAGGAASATLPANLGQGWDRDLTQQELARAARSVKANCGSATDENGNAKGPWGQTQVSIRLHHKGHTKEAKAEGEYAGTPVGHCIEHAFANLQFPPWQGHDITIEWDIEVTKPK